MKKLLLIFISSLCMVFSISAQQNPNQGARYYEVWISSSDSEVRFRGILYEVGDSSILVSGKGIIHDYSSGMDQLKEFSYANIDLVKVRRLKSQTRGAIIGTTVGAGIGLSYGIGLYGESIIMFGGAPALISMFPPAAFGAGAGALLGSIKDRIPIRREIDNFNLYRSSLETYSISHESVGFSKPFEHKGYVGVTVGLIFPVGEDSGAGYGNSFLAGYRFTKNWGISFSQFYFQHSTIISGRESTFSVGGMTAGPIISAPLNNNLRLDFKPGLGFSDASVLVDDVEENTGGGMGLDLNLSLNINISKRGGLLAETGAYSTWVKYTDNDSDALGYIYLNIGYIYKFSRRSL